MLIRRTKALLSARKQLARYIQAINLQQLKTRYGKQQPVRHSNKIVNVVRITLA